MQRMLNGILLLATLTATVALYAITYDTRRLEAKVQSEERALERAERDVSVLRAERAHLARPERLEPLARELGLAPIESGQYLRLDLRPNLRPNVDVRPGQSPGISSGLSPGLSPGLRRPDQRVAAPSQRADPPGDPSPSAAPTPGR